MAASRKSLFVVFVSAFIVALLASTGCRPQPYQSALLDNENTSIRISLANRDNSSSKERFEMVYAVDDRQNDRRALAACVNMSEDECKFDCDADNTFCGDYLGNRNQKAFFLIPAVVSENITVVVKAFEDTNLKPVTASSTAVDTWTHKFNQVGEVDSDPSDTSSEKRGDGGTSPSSVTNLLASSSCSNGSCHGSGPQAGFDTLTDSRKTSIKSRVRTGSMPPSGGLSQAQKDAIADW